MEFIKVSIALIAIMLASTCTGNRANALDKEDIDMSVVDMAGDKTKVVFIYYLGKCTVRRVVDRKDMKDMEKVAKIHDAALQFGETEESCRVK